MCVGSGQIERRIRSGFWPFVHLAAVHGVLLGGRASLSGVRELPVWWEADVKQVSTWVDEQVPLTMGGYERTVQGVGGVLRGFRKALS